MKKIILVRAGFFFLVLFSALQSHSQTSDGFVNKLIENINAYFQAKPHDMLYIHTDRSVYFSGDELLFKAYNCDQATVLPSERSNVCQILLVNSSGEEFFGGFFTLNHGMVHGGFRLPENLSSGRYYILAYPYANEMLSSDKGFIKDIVVCDPAEQIMMDYSLDKEVYQAGDDIAITLYACQDNGKRLGRVDYSYSFTSGDKLIYEGTGLSDKNGTGVIHLSIPESDNKDLSVVISASKNKSRQDLLFHIPVLEEVPKVPPKQGDIKLVAEGFTGDRLLMNTKYDRTAYDDDLQVVVGLFRKGLLYWSAPGTLSQTAKLELPVSRIPSGIMNVVLFDKKDKVLAECLVYNDRKDAPGIQLRLEKEVFAPRDLVKAAISLSNINPASEIMTYLSVSVTHEELQCDEELFIEDYFLVESDLSGDRREDLLKAKKQEDFSIEELFAQAGRRGYSWENMLSGGELESTATISVSDMDLNPGIPSWYKVENILDFSMGIKDRRQPEAAVENYKKQLESGIPVAQVLKTIKPYNLYGNRIVFPGGANSINNQQGALIVIDNQPVGEDFSILRTISPGEVESINVSTDPGQIQRYTGLNTIGVIEIITKGYGAKPRIGQLPDDRDKLIQNANGRYIDGYPDYSTEKDNNAVISDKRKLVYWDPSLNLKGDDTAELSFYTSDMKGKYIITVQGIIGSMPVSCNVAIYVQ